MAITAINKAPTNSIVEMTGLPNPAVNTVEWALVKAVAPCVMAAAPPPAMMARVHFSIGGTSVMTAAEIAIPATMALGVAKVSNRLSMPGR